MKFGKPWPARSLLLLIALCACSGNAEVDATTPHIAFWGGACQPNDGPAFYIRIYDRTAGLIAQPSDTGIYVMVNGVFAPAESQSFSFPGKDGRVNRMPSKDSKGMSGKLSVKHENDEIVEGDYDFRDADGNRYRGKFNAKREHQTVICG